MSKLVALFTIAAFVTMSLIINLPSSEARPIINPVIASQDQAIGAIADHNDGLCEGQEKEDCLIRRTLEAHIDYIYTGDQTNKP